MAAINTSANTWQLNARSPTADGGCGLTMVPSGAMTRRGRNAPSLAGIRGSSMLLTTIQTVVMVAFNGMFLEPSKTGLVPVKSAYRSPSLA